MAQARIKTLNVILIKENDIYNDTCKKNWENTVKFVPKFQPFTFTANRRFQDQELWTRAQKLSNSEQPGRISRFYRLKIQSGVVRGIIQKTSQAKMRLFGDVCQSRTSNTSARSNYVSFRSFARWESLHLKNTPPENSWSHSNNKRLSTFRASQGNPPKRW